MLPAPAAGGVVDVLDRTDVGRRARPPRAARRATRSRRRGDSLATGAMLNPQIPDQAALAREMGALPADAEVDAARPAVLPGRAAADARARSRDDPRRSAARRSRRAASGSPRTRVFSVGIGGVDLGMSAVLARASARGGRLGLVASGTQAAAARAGGQAGIRRRSRGVRRSSRAAGRSSGPITVSGRPTSARSRRFPRKRERSSRGAGRALPCVRGPSRRLAAALAFHGTRWCSGWKGRKRARAAASPIRPVSIRSSSASRRSGS